MEVERQVGRHILVGRLFVRQDDVETDRFAARLAGTAIGRFHDRRTAARAHDELALAVLDDRLLGRQLGQLARFLVIFRLGDQALDDLALFLGQVLRAFERGFRRFGRRNARAAIHHQRRAHPGLVEDHFGLEQFELEAHRAQFLAQQEVLVLERKFVAWMLGLGSVRFEALFLEPGFLFGSVKLAVFDAAPALFVFCHALPDRARASQRQVTAKRKWQG